MKMLLQKLVLRKDGQRLQEINIWIHQATVIVRTLKDRNTAKHMHILILHPIVSVIVEMKKAPEKRVGEANCTWEQAAAASKEKPFSIRQGQEFQYMIRQR